MRRVGAVLAGLLIAGLGTFPTPYRVMYAAAAAAVLLVFAAAVIVQTVRRRSNFCICMC